MINDPYLAFCKALERIPEAVPAPYNWATIPSPLSVVWMAYAYMLDEFARELANSINMFAANVRRLSAWSSVVPMFDENEKLRVTHEFIETLAAHALLSPYVIKSRFAFAVAHLSHQANRATNQYWTDDFPLDRKINLDTFEQYAEHWKYYREFKKTFDTINNEDFIRNTDNFRHIYNHRFSPRIVIGQTTFVTRSVSPSGIEYGFGWREAFQLPLIVNWLSRERDHCMSTFGEFRKLVCEQLEAIGEYSVTPGQ